MKPSHSNRAEKNASGCISKSGRLPSTEEKKERKRLSLPRPGEYHLDEHLSVEDTAVQLRAETLDIPTLLKTAQAFSSEVHLEELLKKLLRFMLENAGAEKGVLLLEEQGHWAIGAVGRPDQVETYLEQPQYLEDTEEMPAEVIRYVERTHEALVLADGINPGYFIQSPYIIKHQCKSILSLPLLNQGRLNSILYLENSLIPGAFKEDHMELLSWLSSQMAVSIDNARLYQQLEQQIEERTRALKEEIAERERVEQALRRREHLFRTLVEHSPDSIARYDRNLRHLITSDITELKQAEETARESERLARSIFDALSEHICILDESGTIVAINRAWREFAETTPPVPRHAAEGANYLAMCEAATGSVTREAQAFAAGIRSVISGEHHTFCMEYPCNTPTELRWFAGRVTRFPGDGPVRLVVLHEDITERKWIEQALRESIELAETAQHEAEITELREEKRRLEAERRRQIAESLRDILSILNSNCPLDEVLDYIVSQAGSMLGSQAAIVYCASGKNGEVIAQAAQGLPGDSLTNAMRPTAQHRLEPILLPSWPVVIPDIAAIDVSQDASSQEIQELLVLAPPIDAYRALLAVPILIKDEVYGRLRLYYHAPHTFSDEEAELAIMFSDQITLAIETARLREQAKQAAVIDERNRLARDLHDSVTQTIFSANLIAEALPRVWESYPEEGRRGLENLHHLIQGALAEMRTLLLELRPAAIVEKNLGELLKQLTQTTASQTRAAITFTVEGDKTLPAEVQIAFYRIAQEALNNIIRHARASHIIVKLYFSPDGVALQMSDNGCGFDPSAIPPDHLGVSIMRERAVSIGATFALTSQPGHGAEILIAWRESAGGQAHD